MYMGAKTCVGRIKNKGRGGPTTAFLLMMNCVKNGCQRCLRRRNVAGNLRIPQGFVPIILKEVSCLKSNNMYLSIKERIHFHYTPGQQRV